MFKKRWVGFMKFSKTPVCMDVYNALMEYGERFPGTFYGGLKEGDLVMRGSDPSTGYYVIDDVSSVRVEFAGKPREEIRRFFYRSIPRRRWAKEEGKIVPFSQTFRRREGGCLEVSMAAAILDPRLFIFGGKYNGVTHALNIAIDGQLCVRDFTIPDMWGNGSHPYERVIESIVGNKINLKRVQSRISNDHRTYELLTKKDFKKKIRGVPQL
jgi:hypothetical protein